MFVTKKHLSRRMVLRGLGASLALPLLAGGGTVVVKILSPDIVHKSEVGGVRLNLTSAHAVREAVAQILARARSVRGHDRPPDYSGEPQANKNAPARVRLPPLSTLSDQLAGSEQFATRIAERFCKNSFRQRVRSSS